MSSLRLNYLPQTRSAAVASPNASFAYASYWFHPDINSFGQCVDLCASDDGVPVCIASAAEYEWIASNASGFMFGAYYTGVYKDPHCERPCAGDEGWDFCVDGGSPYIAWAGYTDDGAAAPAAAADNKYDGQYCMVLDTIGSTRGFFDQQCRRYYWTRCLCGGPAQASAPSPPIACFSKSRPNGTLPGFACRWSSCSQRRASSPFFLDRLPDHATRRAAEPAARGAAGRRPGEPDPAAAARSGRGGGEPARARLIRAPADGLGLFVFGWTPQMGTFFGMVGDIVHGPFPAYLTLFPPGIMLMLLAIRPTGGIAIRTVSAVLFGLNTLIAFGMAFATYVAWVEGFRPYFMYFIATFVSAIVLARAMICSCCCGGKLAQPPRAALRQLWLGVRLMIAGLAGATIAWPIMEECSIEKCSEDQLATIAFCVVAVVVAAVLTPANRGRAHRLLGSLGQKGDNKEAEAACISALIGGGDAGKALDEGAKRLRALPLSALDPSDLATSSDSGLHAKTVPVALGEVDGFVSHSWSDDGAAKHAQLQAWVAEGLPRSDGAKYPLIWLDKACIDQDAIELNLKCLPVFLSGCRSLVVLVGPTYVSRLWCAALPARVVDRSVRFTPKPPSCQVRHRTLRVLADRRRQGEDPRLPALVGRADGGDALVL